MILHTPGGLVLAAEQIAHAQVERPGKVTVIVPHYAKSGGSLIALTADEILMDPNAVLGPVDPQIGDMAAASIVNLLRLKPPAQISDEMLVLADVAQKARVQVAAFVAEVLLKPLPKERAQKLATVLSEGRWTHDPDPGRGGETVGASGHDRHAAAHLRVDGPVPAVGRGTTVRHVRATATSRTVDRTAR